jgi:Uma2 family endonuclease
MSAEPQQGLDYGWLHDDAEEDLVGADWHQDAIRALSLSLKALAEERRWPWHVGDQLTLVGEIPVSREWRPGPDISIHPTLGPAKRREIDVRTEGLPTLLIDVASVSTWKYDVSMESTRRGKRQAGKAFGYLVLWSVPEYLVFDPDAEYIPGQVRAWRRVGQVVQEWRPEADGRYHSALGISLQPDGPLLRAFDPEGLPVPYPTELARENAALRERISAQQQRIIDLEAELERQRRR